MFQLLGIYCSSGCVEACLRRCAGLRAQPNARSVHPRGDAGLEEAVHLIGAFTLPRSEVGTPLKRGALAGIQDKLARACWLGDFWTRAKANSGHKPLQCISGPRAAAQQRSTSVHGVEAFLRSFNGKFTQDGALNATIPHVMASLAHSCN